MKNLNLFNLKSIVRSKARWLLTLIAILTLGVGQMWAGEGFYSIYIKYSQNGIAKTSDGEWTSPLDIGDLTADFKVTDVYLKVWWEDWSPTMSGQLHYWKDGNEGWSGSFNNVKAGTGGSNNREVYVENWNKTLASTTEASGSHTITYKWEAYFSSVTHTLPSDGTKTITYTVLPPAVQSGTFSVSATNVVSGTGTEGDPFVITYGSTTQFTVSGTQDHTDANSSIKGGFGTSTISSSATSSAYTPTTSAQSLTIYGAYVNSTTSSLKGASSNKTIYYKWADPAVPTLSMSSVSPTTLVEGNTVTINVTRSNSSAAISYEYKIGDGSWTSLTPASTSNNGQTATWAIPEAHGATRTFYFRATMSDGGTKTTAASDPVTVYGKKTIHVRNTNDWATFNSYVYDYSAGSTTAKRENWPGSTTGISNMGGQWKDVVLTSQYTYLILNDGSSTNQLSGETYTYSGLTNNGYYTIGGSGNSHTLTSTTTPAAPTVTTAAASSIATTSATLGGSVVVNRDKVTERGYYWSTNSALSSSNLGVGTKVTISGTNNTDDNFSQSKTGLTNGTTYYVIAYATNGFGTSYGSVKSFRTKYVTTVTLDMQGGTDGTSEVFATEGSAMPSGKTAPSKTGYTFGGYYKNEGGDGTQYYNASMTSANNWDVAASTATIYAKWTAKTYDVTLNANGGAESDQIVVATYDATMPTTIKTAGTAIVAPTRTGYNFAGYYDDPDAGEGTQYYTSALVSARTWDKDAATTLYAHWTPKQSALTINMQSSAEGHGSDGTATASASATYGAAMPSLTGTLPTAANGYAFMGFYDAAGGEGTKYYNADGTSATNWDKDTESGTTLYAYYKKAEITTLALSDETVEPSSTVTATATIAPTPTGDTHIDWKLLYSNGSVHSSQPSEFSSTAQSVEFTVPEASGSYKVQAQLRKGTTANAGDLLSERIASFVVAGTHTVTIQYKCGDQVIKTATTVEGVMPLTWSESITAPNDIFGYTFDHWEAGDGVTISTNGSSAIVGTTTTTADIYIKAIYDGRLTAVYTKKNIIYFKNTLSWTNVYYHDSYWDNSQGGAGNKSQSHINQAMSLVPGTTNIYYWEGTPTSANVAFTDATYSNYQAFWAGGGAKVVYPSNPTCASSGDNNYGYNAGTPMFVPIEQDGQDFNVIDGGKAIYYNKGYWRTYDPTTGETGSTGYTLKIYNQTEGNSSRELLQSIPFTNADASGQIFKATINLEAATGYGIKVERDNSLMYTNTTGHLHRTGDVVAMSVNPDNYAAIWIKSTAAGDYDFIITCNGSGQLCLQATFPAAANDYRVLYTDNATWSNGAHTLESWVHPSRVISAEAGATDTISFFVSKDNSPEYKIQKVNNIDEESGAITWTDVSTSWESISVGATGVYNFIFTQPSAESISLSKTEAYTGNYYIRTDNAGSTKWENYRAEDHKMTYSEYAAKITHAGEEWKDFTHYFMKYVDKDKDSGKYKNVKFTVANDYSPCISDTLVRQDGDVTPNNVDAYGNLQASANIRFMWNVTNNKLQRAYLAAAQSDGSKFLVLQGEASKLLAPDGTALSDASGNNKGGGTNAIQFTDKENWMYEAEVKAVPGGRVKLYATYNSSTFYYYGDNTASFTGTSAIDLVSGEGAAQSIRVVYDFKTDRLIAAWMPSDAEIESAQTINADIMLVRNQQGAGQQINLKGSGSISTSKTVYGVMQFNRWTLNNKSTVNTGTTENPVHAALPVGEQKSQYERFNYFISFPFDVKVGEIFGFGTIGRHWRLMYYDGLGRAQEGFFAERGGTNWRMIDDTDSILHANQGYLLQLNSIRMADDNTETWPQKNMDEAELYFPAMNAINTISLGNVTIPALGEEYQCKINLQTTYHTLNNPDSVEADRRIKDSYWRCIGVPGFTSYEATASSWTNFNWNADTENMPYLYEWQMDDNKLNVVSSATFTFEPMHAYLIQNGNSFTWTSVAKPSASVLARHQTPASEDSYYEFLLTMQKGEEKIDHTFIRMTNNESVTTAFDFGHDLSKELNEGCNLYTKIGYERLAANCLPTSEQTTVIPVGVKVTANADYTFAIPDGTSGVGVTLIDNLTGVRTNLSAVDYTVSLEEGTCDDRFVLEISPIKHVYTDISEQQADINGQQAESRKVLIDGLLYIVRDNKIYDARGARVQ